jgi:hypothetical protein
MNAPALATPPASARARTGSGEPGAAGTDTLSEVLRAVRFAGLRDASIGRALAELHDRPTHAFRLGELAREVGLSRSARPSASRSSSAFRRCNTWRSGACSSPRACCRAPR